MKSLFTSLILLFCLNLFAQNDTFQRNPENIKTYPIYNGCESKKDNNNFLQNCMSNKLNKDMFNEISGFIDQLILEEDTRKKFTTRIGFIINKQGYITDVKTISGNNSKFNQMAVISMKRLAQKRLTNKQIIQPAVLDDGTPIDYIFQFPVTLQVE